MKHKKIITLATLTILIFYISYSCSISTTVIRGDRNRTDTETKFDSISTNKNVQVKVRANSPKKE